MLLPERTGRYQRLTQDGEGKYTDLTRDTEAFVDVRVKS